MVIALACAQAHQQQSQHCKHLESKAQAAEGTWEVVKMQAPASQGRTSAGAGAAGAGRAASSRQRAQRGAAQLDIVSAGVAAHLQQAVARVRLRAQRPVSESLCKNYCRRTAPAAPCSAAQHRMALPSKSLCDSIMCDAVPCSWQHHACQHCHKCAASACQLQPAGARL